MGVDRVPDWKVLRGGLYEGEKGVPEIPGTPAPNLNQFSKSLRPPESSRLNLPLTPVESNEPRGSEAEYQTRVIVWANHATTVLVEKHTEVRGVVIEKVTAVEVQVVVWCTPLNLGIQDQVLQSIVPLFKGHPFGRTVRIFFKEQR